MEWVDLAFMEPQDARPEVCIYIAQETAVGMRLDCFLRNQLAYSRTEVRRLLERGAVRLDGRGVGPRAKGLVLRGGERIEVSAPTPAHALAVRADPALGLRILCEGKGWVAVDKAAGVPVHPLREDEIGTLSNALMARFPQMQGVGEGGLRSGVLHRLDVDTSGVVLFATDEEHWKTLRALFKQHRVAKLYRALVSGRMQPEGRLELWLRVARHAPAHVRVGEPGDRGVHPTRLSWRCLETLPKATLVEVSLETGFLHQIRASFASLGHPLLGDSAYGGITELGGSKIDRQMLHAARLRVNEIDVHAPDPVDFAERLAHLRKS